jgi:hypothetical protein
MVTGIGKPRDAACWDKVVSIAGVSIMGCGAVLNDFISVDVDDQIAICSTPVSDRVGIDSGADCTKQAKSSD